MVTFGPKNEYKIVNGVQIYCLNTPNIGLGPEIAFSLLSVKRISRLLEDKKIDIVHGQSPSSFGYAILRKRKIPYVVTIHSTPLGEISSFLDLPFSQIRPFVARQAMITQPTYAVLNYIEYKRADKLIAVSKSVALETVRLFRIDDDKIVVIHNGVNPPNLQIVKEGQDQIILFVGRLVWRKGVQHLLHAMPLVLKEKPDVKLFVVGEGWYKKSLEKEAIRLKLQRSVRFFGHVSPDVLFSLYSKARVFVLPSIYEGLSITVLEAMSMGKPVVVTSVGGSPEFIKNGENGFLVGPGNYLQLAKAILEILNDSRMAKRMGRMARSTILRKFTWKEVCRRTIKLYEEVLTQDGRHD